MSPKPEPHRRTADARDAELRIEGFRVLNNVWHPELPPDAGSQQLCLDTLQALPVSWSWDWSARPGDGVPASFPSLVTGTRPWDAVAGPQAHGLPLPLQAVQSLRLEWRPQVEATGRWNLAIETWLCEPGRLDRDGIAHEVMLWLDHRGEVQPIGRPVLSGDGWVIWHGDGAHWKTSSVVLTRPPRGGRIDLASHLRRLLALRLLDPRWVLADLEFGSEIWDGRGRLRCALPRIHPNTPAGGRSRPGR